LAKNETYKKNESYKKLITGDEGWIFRTKTDFADDFSINLALEDRLKRLHEAFQKKNIEVVIALLPTRGMVHYDKIDYVGYDPLMTARNYQDLATHLRKIGYTVAAPENFSAQTNFFYKHDHHWRPEGAKLMAMTLANEIKQLPVYAEITKMPFRTEKEAYIDHPGTFQKFINDVCGSNMPPETVPAYKTYSLQGNMLNDQPDAEIFLIGTSNSTAQASHANFPGFLKEAIGADIENFSVSGGGVDTSMLDWLGSDQYLRKKPKVVIWEIPVYQNFKGEPFYQQAIPAVYGPCDETSLIKETLPIKQNKFEISSVFQDKKILPKNHYVYLKFNKYQGRKFRLTIEDEEGNKTPFDFRRSKFHQPNGVYYLDLPQDKETPIKKLKGLLPDGASGTVDIQLCEYD
jgi:alginate biosynthesis protein AlgX